MKLYNVDRVCLALVVGSFASCGPIQESQQETNADMVRLAQKLGQPDRILSQELAELAGKEGMILSELKQVASRIITTRAKFDDVDKMLASDAVKFADLEEIPVEQSADLVIQVAYDLQLGSDARVILAEAREAAKKTPGL